MTPLQALNQRLLASLDRASVATCSEWASKYRVMGMPFPGLWSFNHHPWLREMHDSTAEVIVGQKSAQMGYTETALNRVFYSIDVTGESVLYLLPASSPDASDFSSARFDPALEASPHLRRLFSDVANVGHKRAGTANLYIRGSKSRSQLKSIPVSNIVLDELDEMDQDNVVLAKERTSGQVKKSIFEISTPSIAGYGINADFMLSSQKHFYFPCPACNRSIELTFPDCLVITASDVTDSNIKNSHLICPQCKATLPHEAKTAFLAKGYWEATQLNKVYEGYYVSQLYSTVLHPANIASAYLKSLTSAADEQEFYNSKLGLVHEVEGSRVTDAELVSATSTHLNERTLGKQNTIVTLGCDVGKHLHIVIAEYTSPAAAHTDLVDLNPNARCRILAICKRTDFEDIDTLVHEFGVNYVVIDANPEQRKAQELCSRLAGFARYCYYTKASVHRVVTLTNDTQVSVDRTSWLDMALSRFRPQNSSILLPSDTPHEFRVHAKNLVRVYVKDPDGNPVAKYISSSHADNTAHASGKAADHYIHALTYAEIAFNIVAGGGRHVTITRAVI